jgi:hypothetical protein
VRVRTLWELAAAMRDTSVESITLEAHVSLNGGALLPPITGDRDLTITGACNNPTGPAPAGTLPTVVGRRRRLLDDDVAVLQGADGETKGGRRGRGLTQVQFTSAGAYDNLYAGSFRDLTQDDNLLFLSAALAASTEQEEVAPVEAAAESSAEPATYSQIATRYAWDDDTWTHAVEAMFRRGTRFDTAATPENHAEGTLHAHGGPADQIPIGRPAFRSDVSEVPSDDPAPADRCVIDGRETERLFTVGDRLVADCSWPAVRPRRFVPGGGGAVPRLVRVPGRPGLITATGDYSPWGAVAALPWTGGVPGRRCGRLVLNSLVLRRGWSDVDSGAAAGVYGGELELRACVVEGARTGPTAGRGGAMVNKGGSVRIHETIFRNNSAARGRDGGSGGLAVVGGGRTAAGHHVYHYAGSLYVDQVYTLHPTPYTLHPTPYILHPTPCTLHPTPYTLHPKPYTLHPTPYTLHPTPYTLHPAPYTLHPTPYTLHPTPHTLHPAP